MEDEKKRDLLGVDFEDMDIGAFKIKKKTKVVDITEGLNLHGSNSNLDMFNLNTKYLKVDEMNVIKVYNDIIEECSADDKYFQVVKSIISIANRSLVILSQFFLARLTSNLGRKK
jgi:hypothetical protein